ncbi:MAG: LuxR C-terminal-related transcriptional regulator, partial [Actinomycetota bacterium]|nr:LuxR C-terminal-related transcriptional regulator [Actinomycetota bacterium]
LLEQKTNRQIGAALVISEHTVRAHVRSVGLKLNIRGGRKAIADLVTAQLEAATTAVEGNS